MTEKTYQRTFAGRDLTLTIGELAKQADASVRCQYGETIVLATAVMADSVREGVDYMPLLIDYEEKYYAAGKIKGSRFIKREGRPTDIAVITGRIIDRSIRPLFPESMRNDVQVVLTVLSYDGENDPAVPAMLAASTALAISRIPWNGPIGAARIGRVNGAWQVNPSEQELEQSDIDCIVATSKDGALMIEADAKEISEKEFEEVIDLGTKEALELVSFIQEIQNEIGEKKAEPILNTAPENIMEQVSTAARTELESILDKGESKKEVERSYQKLVSRVTEELKVSSEEKGHVKNALRELYRDIVRERILDKGLRADGRKPDEVRDIHAKVGVLPRAHGSALFQRGETQILSVLTLGAPGDSMILDTMTENDSKKRYMHFYNFPGFSVGEVKPLRGPGRRDIGHGMLAERALVRLLPDKEAFGYTIVVSSEVLESNGSSSMGSACGSSLALMDAGVPISSSVAGIAMGLIADEKEQGRNPVVLTDIAGMEDEGGDMDFKVAGTRNGITAVQLDTKIPGLSPEIVRETLTSARTARFHILDIMDRAISKPREELSRYAPRIITIKINPEKIGDLIGPRGKHINEIIEQTGVDIDVEDSGLVTITAKSDETLLKAKESVENLTREIEPGERFSGRVTRIMKFGAFVEILPGTEGLVHISELDSEHVNRVEDVVQVGDTIPVVVTEIDDLGRLNLSHKRAKSDTI